MAPLIALPVIEKLLAEKAGGIAANAIKNDIAVIRTTKIKGKGKHKKLVESELHVNPAAIGVGLVCIGGVVLSLAAAAWLAGFGLDVGKTGSKTRYVARDNGKTGNPAWRIYDKHGIPVRQSIDHYPTTDDILTKAQIIKGWTVSSITPSQKGLLLIEIANPNASHFALKQRSRGFFGGADGDGNGIGLSDLTGIGLLGRIFG